MLFTKKRWLWLAGFLFLVGACQMNPEIPKLGSAMQPIINGQKDLSHPAVGALVVQRQQSFCTGTLITSRLVLTAAHCVDAVNQYRSQGASVEFRIDTPSGSSFRSEYQAVQSTQNHPNWTGSSGSISNDVGVLILTNNVTSTAPMAINTDPMTNSFVGRDFFFLGYGLIQTQPSLVSAQQKYSANIPVSKVSTYTFENYKAGTSVCSGDSGGPAFYNVGGVLKVMGVNSYVQGNVLGGRQPACDGSSTSMRVDAFLSFLQPLMNQFGGSCQIDSDCGPCYSCNSGKCTRRYPNPVQNLCKPCNSPADCGGAQDICVRTATGNRCAQACDVQGCCPQGYVCGDIGGQKQCVPEAGQCAPVSCTAKTDCGPGEDCVSGTCKPEPVNVEAGACKPCTNGTCAAGQACSDLGIGGKRCLQACKDGNFCPANYACKDVSGGRYCVPNNDICPCASNADCESGEVCTNAICQKPGGGKFGDSCSAQKPCASGYQCTPTQSGDSICIQPCGPSAPGGNGSAPGNPGSYCNNSQCTLGGQCANVGAPQPVCFPQSCTSQSDCTNGGQCYQIQQGIQICLCNSNSQCKTGYCNTALFSQFFGQTIGACAQPPSGNPTGGCDAGTACKDAQNPAQSCGNNSQQCICYPQGSKGVGETCSQNELCKDGLICVGTGASNICLETCTPNTPGQCTTGGACNIPAQGGTYFCGCNAQSGCPAGQTCRPFVPGAGICSGGAAQNCGNGTCEGALGENCGTCAADCACSGGRQCINNTCQEPPKSCGDGTCGSGENCTNCPADCGCPAGQNCEAGVCKEPTPQSCGNGKCDTDQGENCGNCVADCGCPPDGTCEAGVCKPKPTEKTTTPDGGSADKGGSTDQGGQLACAPADQIVQCDDNGQNCQSVCPPANTGCSGCNMNPNQDGSPSLLFLLLFVGLLLRRRVR
ncbi:MAG: trypsin-like serine protease [Myxococcales bacterium]|nr:trypsin-like serine protease [Myxococcales bacterium]